MSIRLPPMSAIRAFEAAARHQNFTRAAEELGMTQASVSYQIKMLEDRLGTQLFIREGRQVRLTKAGNKIAPVLTETFITLRAAFQELKDSAEHHLAVTVLPTFAAAWLIPRLGAFQKKHPQISLRLDVSVREADLAEEEFDVGIRTGAGEWRGMTCHLLMPRRLSPVCSPGLLAGLDEVTPRSLVTLPLLGELQYWRSWVRTAGLRDIDLEAQSITVYGTQQLEGLAAIAGTGVALVTPDLFRADLDAGRLVQPFDISSDLTTGFWLVYPETSRRARNIMLFRDWILAEAGSAAR